MATIQSLTKSAAGTTRNVLPLPPTNELVAELFRRAPQASDLIFSPMRPPQVMLNDELVPFELPGLPALIPADTERIAGDLVSQNPPAFQRLQSEGSCDLAYYMSNLGRFRVSILAQRGSYSVSLRVLPHPIRNLVALGLPPQLGGIAGLRDGLVFVTGPAGSGKTTTLAALVDAINETRAAPVITIENPIEYLHGHKHATILQRELYRDVSSFAAGLRGTQRHIAQVIALSDLDDRETVELAIEAAESGQLVLAGLRASNITRALERLLEFLDPSGHATMRTRIARNLRYLTSQRLLPRGDGAGRVPLCEILVANPKTRGVVEKAGTGAKTLSYAMRDGESDGMQCFEDALDQLMRSGTVTPEMAKRHAGDILEVLLESRAVAGRPRDS